MKDPSSLSLLGMTGGTLSLLGMTGGGAVAPRDDRLEVGAPRDDKGVGAFAPRDERAGGSSINFLKSSFPMLSAGEYFP